MQNRGLIFIPDISGFTRFINEIEIEHGRMIIQELLEIMINSNRIGLEVSEIEGDAILFYKFGDPPTLEELYKQVQEMFCAFHKSLMAYDHHKYCQCPACVSAVNLTLKVITHYGEFTGYQVRNFNKLIGKDIIVAHQLLKNDIAHHEYWLVTQNLLHGGEPEGYETWMRWKSSAKETESGPVTFQYTQLGELKNELSPERLPPLDLREKVKVLSFTQTYEAGIIPVFHAAGDFNYRHRWWEGVKSVAEINHFLPRIGMRCRYVQDDGEAILRSSSYNFSDDRIEFSETDELRNITTYYTLQKKDNQKTQLTLDVYWNRNWFSEIMFRLTQKRKTEELFQKSMNNLHHLVKEIKMATAPV